MGNTPSVPSGGPSQSSGSSSSSASACPVDPAARQAYLEAAAAAASAPATKTTIPIPSSASDRPTFHYGVPVSVHTNPTAQHDQNESSPKRRQRQQQHAPLPSSRVTSTIPRAPTSPSTVTPSPTSPTTTIPSSPNSQTALPATSTEGNWIYPSERMFFDALQRKNQRAEASDMSTVVPIHNAVNERAWTLIKDWEMRYAKAQNESCSGPRLRSFSGDSGKLSPRARWLGWWGYERPFDRHDWVVERCPSTPSLASAGGGGGDAEGKGKEVEYVIDFYRGRESENGGGRPGGLNFFLDVRPKLNSWEGWRMRVWRFWGL